MDRALFPSLLGNERIKSNLALDIAGGKCAHAYIIEGAAGSGKHTLARQICASSVCERRGDSHSPVPCGTCPLCHRILTDISADVTFINRAGKASIGVEAIRTLKQTLYITPNDGEKKFYIIEDAELMTTQAQNSLLLSLEEPPDYVMILLLTTDASTLLETIRSRAPVIRMESFPPTEVLRLLKSGRFFKAGTYSADRLENAAALSRGTIGEALRLLKESGEEAKVTSSRTLAKQLAEGLVDSGKVRTSELLEFLSSSLVSLDRESMSEVLLYAQSAIRDMIVSKKAEDSVLLFYLSEGEIPAEVRRTSIRRLLSLYDALREAQKTISMNGSVLAALTDLVLKRTKS